MVRKCFFVALVCACFCACDFNNTVELILKKINLSAISKDAAEVKQSPAPTQIAGNFSAGGIRTDDVNSAGVHAADSAEYQTLDTSLLDAIAETERSHGYVPGLGLNESLLREKSGDLAGAVIAAYKDLAWAYSFNNIEVSNSMQVTKNSIETGIRNIKELYSKENKPDVSDEKRIEALNAADAVIYFIKGQYKNAAAILSILFRNEDEPDAFSRWMLLVCGMEQDGANRAEQSQYAAIQARYSVFPAYWYFGARNFSGAIAADYAERCINVSPGGPYAAECRNKLAVFVGLNPSDGKVMLSRDEIKQIITDSIRNYDPELLSALIPLIALNDNPYTVFASGALRELAVDEKYKTWFEKQAVSARKNSGANSFLAGRLNYIARG